LQSKKRFGTCLFPKRKDLTSEAFPLGKTYLVPKKENAERKTSLIKEKPKGRERKERHRPHSEIAYQRKVRANPPPFWTRLLKDEEN